MAADIIELKTGQFSAVSLTINSSSLTAVKRSLSRKIKSSPIFFRQMSVVLNCTPALEKLNLVTLKELLSEYGITVIGVTQWQNSLQKEVIISAGLPALGNTLQLNEILPEYRYIAPLLVERDIENGEVIYAKNQDLLIYGDVKEGAEILSDGIIHVYGRLQGLTACDKSAEVQKAAEARIAEIQKTADEQVAAANEKMLAAQAAQNAAEEQLAEANKRFDALQEAASKKIAEIEKMTTDKLSESQKSTEQQIAEAKEVTQQAIDKIKAALAAKSTEVKSALDQSLGDAKQNFAETLSSMANALKDSAKNDKAEEIKTETQPEVKTEETH